MRQTYMDHHLILLSNLCMSVCILSDDMKNRQAIITAVIICLECSWGYGYVCVRIVLTLPILRVPKSGRELPLCLSEPMRIYIFVQANSILAVSGKWRGAELVLQTSSRTDVSHTCAITYYARSPHYKEKFPILNVQSTWLLINAYTFCKVKVILKHPKVHAVSAG